MAQSLMQIYLHLIFHVKNSSVKIKEADIPLLHAYTAGTLKSIGSIPLQGGGINDHMHVLCTLPKALTIPDLVEKLKKSCNKHLKTHDANHYRDFHWQNGYAAFSVSGNVIFNVKGYISHQKEHHAHRSFEEEYLSLMKELGIEFNEKYVLCD